MQAEPKNIIKAFLGRESLGDVPKDEIRSLAEKHPYSALIQYLLTRRLQLSGDPGYAESVARTAIYFHNPHWLSLLLRRQTSEERMNQLEESLGLTGSPTPASTDADVQLEEERLDEANSMESVEAAGAAHQQTDVEAIPSEESSTETLEAEGTDYLQSSREEEAPATETVEVEEAIETGRWTGPEETDNDDDVSVHAAEESKPVMELQMPEVLGETEEAIPIQPLHTLDYFASVGMNLEQEAPTSEDPKVLRFSDWLRSMKPIHRSIRQDDASSLPDEEAVDQGAEEANEVEEILTEAMAEVYEKQGLRLKAIAVYSKLSLLHPDKSSIFAAKIEQLKGISS